MPNMSCDKPGVSRQSTGRDGVRAGLTMLRSQVKMILITCFVAFRLINGCVHGFFSLLNDT